jgi:hypothetical protein
MGALIFHQVFHMQNLVRDLTASLSQEFLVDRLNGGVVV